MQEVLGCALITTLKSRGLKMFLLDMSVGTVGKRIGLSVAPAAQGDELGGAPEIDADSSVFDQSPTIEFDVLMQKIAGKEEFTIPQEGRLKCGLQQRRDLNKALSELSNTHSFEIEQNGRSLQASAITLSGNLITAVTPQVENILFDNGEIKISFVPINPNTSALGDAFNKPALG